MYSTIDVMSTSQNTPSTDTPFRGRNYSEVEFSGDYGTEDTVFTGRNAMPVTAAFVGHTDPNPKRFTLNGRDCSKGEVNQKARAACNGADDFVYKIARLEIGESLNLKRLGSVKRIEI